MARFPLSEVFTNWGMTELSSIVTMTSATDSVEKKLRTAGRLLPSFTAKIVDPQTLQTLPWGQRGEIMVSGFGVMHSYYNDPLQSAKTIHVSPSNVTCGGDEPTTRWLRTGDEGYLDHEGYFVITGRIKELIIRGGENISPLEIEARLFEHPAVKQVAVFGVSSHRYGEEVAAMLESQGSGLVRPSTTEIQSWVSAALSRYKVPKYIWWLGDKDLGLPDVWPKTANGKLRKSEIRSLGEGISQKIVLPDLNLHADKTTTALLKRECFDQATHLKGKL